MNNSLTARLLLASLVLSPAVVRADIDPQQIQAIESMTHLTDRQGQLIKISEDDWLEPIKGKPNLLLWCSSYIDRGCNILDINSKELILDADYLDIEPVPYKDSVYYVISDDAARIGVLNDKFQLQIDLKYPRAYPYIIYPDSVLGEDYNFECSPYIKDSDDIDKPLCLQERSEPYLFVREQDKFGLLRFNNTAKQPLIYSRIDIAHPSNNKRVRFTMTDNQGRNKYGYFDEKLDVVIPAKYEVASHFKFGVANVRLNNKFGFIDGHDKTIIPFTYERADGMLWRNGFDEPTASVIEQGVPKLVGLSGKYYDYDISQDAPLTYQHGLAAIKNAEGKYTFIKSNSQLLTPFKYDKAEDFIRRFNKQGKEVVSAQVVENNRSYYIDSSGKAISEFLYRTDQVLIRSGEQIYNGICQTCHEDGLINAPKLGDPNDWKDRIKKGKWVLYDHAINGFNAMPARGGSYIADKEVKNAVDYMLSKVQ